jgi:excisionase family DNA binding protein
MSARFEPETNRRLAHDARGVLSKLAEADSSIDLHFKAATRNHTVQLPPEAVPALLEILEALEHGDGVRVVREQVELSTSEAARQLHVSRPYLVKLLEQGAMPFRKVGNQRRIRRADFNAYKRADEERRHALLEQLTREAQEQGHGYDR